MAKVLDVTVEVSFGMAMNMDVVMDADVMEMWLWL